MHHQGEYIQDERVKLPEGMQKKLILLAKETSHLSWPKLSAQLGVSEITAKIAWRHERSTLPKGCYIQILKLIPKQQQEKFSNNVQILRKNWGQSKGGAVTINKIRQHNHILVGEKFAHTPEFAEFIGAMLGDGHLSEVGIRITLEYPYEMEYANYLATLIKGLFGVSPIIYPYTKFGREIRVIVNSTTLVSLLKKENMVPGDKVKNNVGIPRFILDDKKLLAPCIRGLIDTDGGFFAKDSKRTRIFMEFKSSTPKLRGDFREGLESLGFATSKSKITGVRVQNQNDVKNLIDLVGTKNPKTIKKLSVFFKTGKMPLTTEIHRKLRASGPIW